MIVSHFRCAGLLLAIACAVPAIAAPRVVSSTPAANAQVGKPARVDIRFSEAVPAQGALIELTMTGMPGMAHHAPMKIAGFRTEVARDGQSIAAVLPRPLPLGTYSVAWRAGGGQGQFAFTVK